MNYDLKKAGKRIAQKRKNLKILQSDIAGRIGVTKNYISNIENGHTSPSLPVFLSICNELKETPDYFLLGSFKINPSEKITDMLKMLSLEEIDFLEKLLETYINQKTDFKSQQNMRKAQE